MRLRVVIGIVTRPPRQASAAWIRDKGKDRAKPLYLLCENAVSIAVFNMDFGITLVIGQSVPVGSGGRTLGYDAGVSSSQTCIGA